MQHQQLIGRTGRNEVREKGEQLCLPKKHVGNGKLNRKQQKIYLIQMVTYYPKNIWMLFIELSWLTMVYFFTSNLSTNKHMNENHSIQCKIWSTSKKDFGTVVSIYVKEIYIFSVFFSSSNFVRALRKTKRNIKQTMFFGLTEK